MRNLKRFLLPEEVGKHTFIDSTDDVIGVLPEVLERMPYGHYFGVMTVPKEEGNQHLLRLVDYLNGKRGIDVGRGQEQVYGFEIAKVNEGMKENQIDYKWELRVFRRREVQTLPIDVNVEVRVHRSARDFINGANGRGR